jgi:hypothetical protein
MWAYAHLRAQFVKKQLISPRFTGRALTLSGREINAEEPRRSEPISPGICDLGFSLFAGRMCFGRTALVSRAKNRDVEHGLAFELTPDCRRVRRTIGQHKIAFFAPDNEFS